MYYDYVHDVLAGADLEMHERRVGAGKEKFGSSYLHVVSFILLNS